MPEADLAGPSRAPDDGPAARRSSPCPFVNRITAEVHMLTTEMIATHPDVKGRVNPALIQAIEAAYACAQTCTSCADACLAEEMVAQLRQCIRYNMDCADVCAATATVSNRRTGANEEVIRRMLEACVTACRRSGEECQRHATHHEHCRICAEACRQCEQACQAAAATM